MPRSPRQAMRYERKTPLSKESLVKLFSRLALAVVFAGSLALSTEKSAHALGPVDVEAGLKAGVGTNPDSNGSNPYGFGLGGRAGVNIFNVYLGASAIHYFGSSESAPGGSADISSTLIGGELGYTITAIPVIQIRPQLGIGSASYSLDGTVLGIKASTSDSHLYLEPGVTVLVPLGLLYVGADANALIVPDVGPNSDTYTSLTLHGQVGVRF